MSLIKTALEGCDTCTANKHGFTATKSGFQTDNSINAIKDGFTYDDNKGIKDSVVLTGPLSEIYTKALNITLRKTPLTNKEDDTPDVKIDTNIASASDEKLIVGTESMIQDEDTLFVVNQLKNRIDDEQNKFISDNYDFSTLQENPNNVVANIAIMNATDAVRPETIEKLHDYQECHTDQDIILVVTVPTDAVKQGIEFQQKLINLNPRADILGPDAVQLEAAFESIYAQKGIKVFYGLEGFKEAIEYVSRKL